MSSFSIQHFLIRADVIEGYGVYLPKRLEKWTSVFKILLNRSNSLCKLYISPDLWDRHSAHHLINCATVMHSSFQVLFVGGSKQDFWMSLTYCS